MTWLLAFLGFSLLIVLHEGGHFAAAKAVGMRVERFSLFFGKPIWSVRRGETEYGIGPIPLGGYVRISGMNPYEELAPEVVPRSYYRQPVWKRVVVIAAGPAVNLLLAFLLLWGIFLANGEYVPSTRVAAAGLTAPAVRYLQPGDRIVSVDGVRATPDTLDRVAAATGRHRCAGTPVAGCVATTPAHVVVVRDGRRLAFDIRPRYDARKGIERTRLGFGFDAAHRTYGVGHAASVGVSRMWWITRESAGVFARLFESKERKQVTSVVGAYEVTRQSISVGAAEALYVLAIISLSLAILNLLPLLPLDGGHIFWALVEKLRGRAVPFAVMERASAIGIALVAVLVLIGVSNDIGRLQDGGFNVR